MDPELAEETVIKKKDTRCFGDTLYCRTPLERIREAIYSALICYFYRLVLCHA